MDYKQKTIKIILGIGDVLSGKLLCYDALSYQTTILNIKKSENEIQKVLLNKVDFNKQELNNSCKVEDFESSIKEFVILDNVQFIDVRESHEQPKVEGITVTNMPLNSFLEHLDLINSEKKKAVFCESGIRCKMAVFILNKHNIHNCYSIKEGASEINSYIKELQNKGSNER